MKIIHSITRKTHTRSPKRVALDWFLNPATFQRLLPNWGLVRFVTSQDDLVTLKLGWLTWVLKQDETTFIQVKGPFSFWKYTFSVEEGAIDERVEFATPFNFFAAKVAKEIHKTLAWRQKRMDRDLAGYPPEPQRILLSGSSGLIGKELDTLLKSQGHVVYHLVRKKGGEETVYWNPSKGELNLKDFDGFDAVIHLAGKNISTLRWSQKVKDEIFLSRARDTWLLSQVLLRQVHPPKTIITASAVGIYNEGYLALVCKEWEEATVSLESRGTRGVHARFGVVLSPRGGMLAKLIPSFKMGLGAILGSGKQWVSWVSIDDAISALNQMLQNSSLVGAINVTAPAPVTIRELSTSLAQALHRPLFLKVGEKTLKSLFGQMAEEVLLASCKENPEKLLSSGFEFEYPQLDRYLKQLFS